VSPTATPTYTLTGLTDSTLCAALPTELTGSAVVSVNTPPTITASPQSQSVVAGATVTFTVSATGTAPLTYQWSKNGIAIPGATAASLVLPSVSVADSGSRYKALVSNVCSSASSSEAILTVTPVGTVTGVVIEEIYPGGGKSGASYQNDFVVLRNNGSAAASLNGWSLQHLKGGVWQKPFTLPNVSIPAGGYFLIKAYNDGTSSGAALPTPDATTPQNSAWNFNTTGASAVALVKNRTKLTACAAASIVDLVGFNTAAGNCYEGSGVAPAGSATRSLQRLQMGTQDTGNNAADFTLAAPTPR
jgi:hypothetical protein